MVGSSTNTSMGMCNTQLPQFNGKNYDYWAITMRALFASQDLWEFVEDGFEEPTDENEFNNLTRTKKEWLKSYKKKDSKSLLFLYQAVHESVFPRIAATKTSKEAWKTIKTAYQGMEKVKTAKLQLLRRDFENLCMKESDNIDSFFTQVIGLVTQIRSHGEILEERRIVEKLLRVLPSNFDVIVTTIEETKDLTNFSVDELHASLITHEQRLSRNENSSLEHAFKTQMSFGRGRGQGKGNKRGRGRSQNRGGRNSLANAQGRGSNPNQNQGQGNNQQSGQHHAQRQRYEKSNVQCYYCKTYDHYANEYRKKQHDMNNRSSANFTRENISQENLLLACNMVETKSDDIWFLDSGCSNHMTRNIALFSKLDQSVKSQVTLGTDSKVSVMGKCEVNILTRKGEKKTIADVYYVPGMKCNLLSIGQLVQKGYNVLFDNDVCTIMDRKPNKLCIVEVKMTRNRMFSLRIKAILKSGVEIAAITQEAFQSEPKDENWLWHLRFGHLNFGGLNLLHRKGMFTTRYTPQQNGVAERKNRTIMDMAKSMLKEKHLPNDYWAEVVHCATYILNRCPKKAVMNRVPKEAWSGRKQRVTHMKVFGCVAYAHIPDQLRKKLDSKGEKCIFIGYNEESKAYRLYNPSTKKFFVSRYVQFIEEEALDGSIEKTVNVKNSLSHDEDDEEMAEIHPQTATPTQGQQLTPLRRNECVSPSTPQGGNSSASSSTCTPNERGKKFRNLSDIYDEGMNSLFALYCHVDDPVHFEEAIKDKKWIEAMDEEINAIERNKTWDLVELLKGKEVIGVKWVYKTKSNAEGKIKRHKARLVVKGYKQQYGRDYEETFASVARMETVREVLFIAAQNKWKVYQMDVKLAFLNGVLMEEVYIEQPLGYEKKGQEHKVCRLKKALYGLKQAPRAWYSRIDSYRLENGFEKCEGEPTLYIKENDGKFLIVVLYVDDVIFTGNDDYLIENFKAVMKEEFEMTDMGLLRYFLGIETEQSGNGIFISQEKYVNEVLERFNM
eukprot:PITA_26028